MYAAHAQIESRRFPRLDLASSNNPQRLFAHHHHRRQQPGAPRHHRRQPLPPPTTTIVDNNWARHVATIANPCHHPPPPSSGRATPLPVANRCHHPRPSLAAHNSNSRRRKQGGNATSPPLAHQTKERAGDDMATCHVVQTVTMDAIVTVCSTQVSCHLPSPPLRSHRLQGLRRRGQRGNHTTSTSPGPQRQPTPRARLQQRARA